VVVGEVVAIHLADDLVDDRLHVNADRLRALGRMGGRGYTHARVDLEMFPDRRALGEG
jgi:flavin reductase (DIM6/NTAB) family NADH-FMN oxidoreductase RutF